MNERLKELANQAGIRLDFLVLVSLVIFVVVAVLLAVAL